MLTAPDASPYAAVNPDRRAAMARVALLAKLARPEDADTPRVLVVDAAGLVRRLPPPDVLRAHTQVVVAEDGSTATPPSPAAVAGTSACRWSKILARSPCGALLDVWRRRLLAPVRRTYGDP